MKKDEKVFQKNIGRGIKHMGEVDYATQKESICKHKKDYMYMK